MLLYARNIIGPSSEIFGNLHKVSEKCSERSSFLQNNFGKSSEIFGKWLEIFGKSSKTPSSVCLNYKKNITRQFEDMNFMFLPLEHKIHIFSPPCNILYI